MESLRTELDSLTIEYLNEKINLRDYNKEIHIIINKLDSTRSIEKDYIVMMAEEYLEDFMKIKNQKNQYMKKCATL